MDLWCMHASDQFFWRYWVVRYPQCPPLHCNSVMLMCHQTWIGGFREGAKGDRALPSLFSCIFKMSYDFALKIVL